MKALKITIIALLAGFSMVSCDFLDKEPTKLTPENYFNTPAEANSFLTGIYAILSQPTFYGGDRKSTRLNSSHNVASRMPSSA